MEWTEDLTTEQIKLEQWMLALRLEEGFPKTWLTSPAQKTRAQVFEKEGLLETHPFFIERKRLTPRGFALSDQIIAMLVP